MKANPRKFAIAGTALLMFAVLLQSGASNATTSAKPSASKSTKPSQTAMAFVAPAKSATSAKPETSAKPAAKPTRTPTPAPTKTPTPKPTPKCSAQYPPRGSDKKCK